MVPHQQYQYHLGTVRNADSWKFPGSPGVRTLCFTAKGTGSSPGQGTDAANYMAWLKKKRKCRFLSFTPYLLNQTLGWDPAVVFQQDFQIILLHTKVWKTPVHSFPECCWYSLNGDLIPSALKSRTPRSIQNLQATVSSISGLSRVGSYWSQLVLRGRQRMSIISACPVPQMFYYLLVCFSCLNKGHVTVARAHISSPRAAAQGLGARWHGAQTRMAGWGSCRLNDR